MQLVKPIVWYAVFAWSGTRSCNYLIPKLFEMMTLTNTFDVATTSSLCTTGIKVYWENYFTAGNHTLPNNVTWAGSE
jgi:cytosine/uracil/thiamine/allantoin permease